VLKQNVCFEENYNYNVNLQLLERRNQDPEELPMLELQIKDNDRAIQIFVQGIYIHKQKSVIAV
jgi:hypothetical protein